MIKDVFEIEDSLEPISIVGYETFPSNKSGKTYRSDLLVILSDKSYVLIEMNNSNGIEAIDRNLVQLVRIHGQVIRSGTDDMELRNYRLRGINFNNFRNETGKPIDTFAFCSLDTNEIASKVYIICNISLVKCRELVYDKCIDNLPKVVRWGSILLEEDINKISQILGDDMLSMEEKERLLKTIEDVNNDEAIMTEWMLEENARLKRAGEMLYARDEGIEQGIEINTTKLIKNMLKENADYDFISKVTGKSIDEIKNIENNV